MSAPVGSLGDFFAKKGKNKKVVGVNLNKVGEAKTEEKKVAKVGKDEEGWEEDEVVAPTMKVESAKLITREEDKKEEEEAAAPAWGTTKASKGAQAQEINEKKFPTLAKAVGSSNINLDVEAKIHIKTTKNVFAALEEDDATKLRKEIRPSLVTKKKGETQKDALAREMKAHKDEKKKKRRDDDESSEEEEVEVAEEVKQEKRVEKKKEKKVVEAPKAEVEEEEDDGEPKIQADLEASRRKYEHRRKLEKADLPRSELQAEKENKPVQVSAKKKKFAMEEVEKPKLEVWED